MRRYRPPPKNVSEAVAKADRATKKLLAHYADAGHDDSITAWRLTGRLRIAVGDLYRVVFPLTDEVRAQLNSVSKATSEIIEICSSRTETARQRQRRALGALEALAFNGGTPTPLAVRRLREIENTRQKMVQ